MNWVLMWPLKKANRAEAQLWLKANIAPLIREVDNLDGSKKTKLRPIALLETPLKLIESVAVDEHADHTAALMQEQQVVFRVRDGAEAMISAVRKNNEKRHEQSADARGQHFERVWLNQQHIPCLAPLCEEERAHLQRCEGCRARKHTEQCDLLRSLLDPNVGIARANKLSTNCDGLHLIC